MRNANNSAKFKTKLHDDDEKPDKNLKIKPTKSEAEELEKKIKTIKKVTKIITYLINRFLLIYLFKPNAEDSTNRRIKKEEGSR